MEVKLPYLPHSVTMPEKAQKREVCIMKVNQITLLLLLKHAILIHRKLEATLPGVVNRFWSWQSSELLLRPKPSWRLVVETYIMVYEMKSTLNLILDTHSVLYFTFPIIDYHNLVPRPSRPRNKVIFSQTEE